MTLADDDIPSCCCIPKPVLLRSAECKVVADGGKPSFSFNLTDRIEIRTSGDFYDSYISSFGSGAGEILGRKTTLPSSSVFC